MLAIPHLKIFCKKLMNSGILIPNEFSANGYRLFGELSDVVHGDCDDETGLEKYNPLYRLVVGVIENVKNNNEMMSAIGSLGWNDDGGEPQ
jgi:hypothetical protein